MVTTWISAGQTKNTYAAEYVSSIQESCVTGGGGRCQSLLQKEEEEDSDVFLSPIWRSQTPPRSHSLPSSFKVNVAQPNTPIVVKVQRHVMFLTIPIQYMQYLVWLNGNPDFSISSPDRNRYCDKN